MNGSTRTTLTLPFIKPGVYHRGHDHKADLALNIVDQRLLLELRDGRLARKERFDSIRTTISQFSLTELSIIEIHRLCSP